MKKRILSAVVGIALILAVIFISLVYTTIFIDVFVAGVCAIAVYEFTKAIKTLNIFQMSVPSISFALVYPMLASYGMSMVIWYIYTIIMLSMMIFFHKEISFKEFSYTYSMTSVITMSLAMIIDIKALDQSHSVFYFVLSLGLPWLADAGAYFIGVFFGKHKLCPDISPKKTIEGAVGGVAVCIVTTLLIGLLFDLVIYGDGTFVDYTNLVIMSLCGSLISIIGDLSFSVIKRSYSVKDYGDIIPGHGGILDRFDSVIVFVPFMFIMVSNMPIIK